ncbi:MAG: CoA transferase [Dehalococcoidales bacterium]|nr:CoA transferase [Dehalococcoidales bacterium]
MSSNKVSMPNLKSNQAKALSGVKVLELAEWIAAPYCSRLLADLGAEVIKIEKPGQGDETRNRGPFPGGVPHPEKSGLFIYLNTNKLGVTLDVKTATGQKIFLDLVRQADILVEDNPPRLMKRLGLTFNKLKSLNPRLIMTSITPFGQTGPYKDYKAYPVNTFHSSGEGYFTPSRTEFAGRPPVNLGKNAAEYPVGIIAAGITNIALRHARKTGAGEHIDVSKQEALLFLNLAHFSTYLNKGVLPKRGDRGYNITRIYPCKDGHVLFYYHQKREWQAMLDIIGNPDWGKEEALANQTIAEERAAEVIPLISAGIKNRTKAELFKEGRAKGCSLVPCSTVADLMRSEHLKERKFFAETEHPDAGKLRLASAPYSLSQSPFGFDRAAPRLGEHNREIYVNRLGYSSRDLVTLRQAGVI